MLQKPKEPVKKRAFLIVVFLSAGLITRAGLLHAAPPSLLEAQPQLHALYDADPVSLSKAQRIEMAKYGLRFAPLDQRIWGIRYLDKLDNRHLVPIRPLYLRLSEDPAVRTEEVELEFSFYPVNFQQMTLQPHTHAAMFEIGFAGELVPGLPGRRLKLERGYVARLSGHYEFHSGLLFRSHHKSVFVAEGKEPMLRSQQVYKVRLELSEQRAVLFLDGEEFAAVSGTKLDRGLLSLTTGWHPLSLSQLHVRGTKMVDGKRVPFDVSGLRPND